jgi:hypothetical protein
LSCFMLLPMNRRPVCSHVAVQENLDVLRRAVKGGYCLYVKSTQDPSFCVRFADTMDPNGLFSLDLEIEWDFTRLCTAVSRFYGHRRIKYMYQADANLSDIRNPRQLWHHVRPNSTVYIQFAEEVRQENQTPPNQTPKNKSNVRRRALQRLDNK